MNGYRTTEAYSRRDLTHVSKEHFLISTSLTYLQVR